ncbi:hypothetical protein D3C71_1823270 [compost metagenome]
MSRRGNCWDNAVAESFFSTLKKERIKKHICADQETAALDLAEDIDSFYNPVRRCRYLGGVSPNEFEAAHRKQKSSAY